MQINRSLYEERARIIKALAHPDRLLIVDLLAKKPLCVCDIRQRVGTDMSTVSKHLLVLKNAGIVRDERRGVQIFYHLRCSCVSAFFTCAEAVIRQTMSTRTKLLCRSKAAKDRGLGPIEAS